MTTTTPTPNYGSGNSGSKNNNLLAIAGIIIAGLLGLNIYMWVNKSATDKKLTTTSTELTEQQKLNAELEKQYTEASQSLESMKTNNKELNDLIEKQKADLAGQKEKIASLINAKKDLGEARAELGKLKGIVEQYKADIEAKDREIAGLKTENQGLVTAKGQLENDLSSERDEKKKIADAKAALVSEKEKTDQQNQFLSKKVNQASVVKVGNIAIQGLTVTDSGKEKKRKFAKNVERVNICFDAAANDVADGGKETFYIKVENPTGETIFVESAGVGGEFTAANGEKIRYSTKQEVDYNNAAKNVCIKWDPGLKLTKGIYEIKVYNKGYLCGQGTYKLK